MLLSSVGGLLVEGLMGFKDEVVGWEESMGGRAGALAGAWAFLGDCWVEGMVRLELEE